MTTKPASVRVATRADEDRIFALMHLAHKENAVACINNQKVWDKIRLATRKKGGVIGIIDGPKGLEGVICMCMAQWWYSDDWHVEELINFVHPDCRRSDHAKDLLSFAKWFTEQMELPLFIGVLSNIRTEAKVRLYGRRLDNVGAVFCHNMNKEIIHG